MNTDAFIRAGIDFDDGLGRCMNNEELYSRLLGKFRSDKSFFSLSEAMKEGNAQDAFEWAHTLKGVAANLGLAELGKVDSLLTEALREPADLDKAGELFPEVEKAYKKVIAFLDEEKL